MIRVATDLCFTKRAALSETRFTQVKRLFYKKQSFNWVSTHYPSAHLAILLGVSVEIKQYFKVLDEQVAQQYKIAGAARAKGFDPSLEVEALPTRNLAERVEGLVGPKYIADEIKKCQEEKLPREKIVERIIDWILKGTYLKDLTKQQRIEQALRTSLAILTEGVVSAPLEGISQVKIEKNPDGSDYLSVFYAGPIRGAGGTAAALSVLLADYIRRKEGIRDYRPTDTEVERYKEEIKVYHRRVVRLQYLPTDDEVNLIVRNVPICIDGDPTEEQEVDINKGLARVKTDRIRGGICLVIGEGIAQKYKKVLKFADGIELTGWEWLKDMKKGAAKTSGTEVKEIRPNKKFLEDIVAGRPIFAYPMEKGGFRLRYGRSNMCGVASKAIHPATMEILDEFPAVGTQFRIERPGKGMVVAPCAEMEGPVIKDAYGNVRIIGTPEDAKAVRFDVVEILALGDILVPFGDFLNSNETLPPSGYVEEWWELEYAKAGGTDAPDINGQNAVEISERLKIPLHPKYTAVWHDITVKDLKKLIAWIEGSLVAFEYANNKLIIRNNNPEGKRVLELLLLPHSVSDENIILWDYAIPFLASLGALVDKKVDFSSLKDVLKELKDEDNAYDVVKNISPITVRKKVGCYVGARMGRPEKAKERLMEPAPHVLFPVGEAGGNTRSIDKASKNTFVRSEVARMRCPGCKKMTFMPKCPDCAQQTFIEYKCPVCGAFGKESFCRKCRRDMVAYEMTEVPLKGLMELAETRVKTKHAEEIKGVKGLSSAVKVPEPIEKGVLRAKNRVFVFKDGTIRYDGTDVPSTHFRPADVHVPVERLKELGYDTDAYGKPLERPDQIVPLMPQDIIIPEDSVPYLTNLCNFIDELLESFYGLERFYKIKMKSDLVGQLVTGLAPHTSAAILGRIIGFADVKCIIAHPFWHCAKRRNCLVPQTEIFVLNSDKPRFISLESLFERSAGGLAVDDFGTIEKNVQGISTLALNPVSGKFERKRITSVVRAPAPAHLLEIKTKSGRSFTASPEHRVFVNSDNGPSFKRLIELQEGDTLMVPRELRIDEHDIGEIDLLEEIPDDFDIMLRGIRDFVEDLLHRLGGLQKASVRLGMSKKTLSNYVYRDSVPLDVLRKLLKLCGMGLKDVPDCRLAAKRDTTEVKRRIMVDSNLMRLVGYYLAEGHARYSKKSFYQLSFACPEKSMSEDIYECAGGVFGLKPGRNDIAVTISSRIAHYMFTEMLGLGKNAYEKRIPPKILSLPKPKVRELMGAYFSGDGSVEKGRLHVTCCSVNEGLLRDMGFLLSRFGIFYRLKEEVRTAGGCVKEFYLRKGEAMPKFKAHYISIRSEYARLFHDEVGFSLKRKQNMLTSALSKERAPRVKRAENVLMDPIRSASYVKARHPFVYDIEVEDNHTFLMNDLLVSANCDGDEDAIMMLMDVLLNFSYAYLPEKRGGRMDAPLVINTNLDPKEIDSEAHCMEVGFSYPLEFYEKTLELPSAKEMKMIDVVENHLKDDPFSIGLTKFSTWAGAPKQSRYTQLGEMEEKTDVELKLCRKIRAVDVADAAKRLVDYHLIRDTYGNLRAFARQKFRCVKCNSKYRRVPLVGKCPACGGRVILTVSKGTIEKYVDLTDDVVKNYIESDYIKQRMDLVKKEIKSVFENEKVRQFSISDFA